MSNTSFSEIQTQSKNLQTDQYVGFVLQDEEYGMPILSVREIIRYETITRLPQSPDYIEGVLNLRGQVIPVVNLRKKFNLPEKNPDKTTRIMVAEIGDRMVGMVLDAVTEVLQINPSEISPPPQMGAQLNTDFIAGMGKVGDHLMILLDLNRILSTEETVHQEVATLQ